MLTWKWLVLAVLLALAGLLVAASLGTRRGTRLYRLRVRLLGAAVALAAAGGLVLSVSGCKGKAKETPLCYSTSILTDAGSDDEPADPDAAQNVEEAKEE